MKKLKTGILGMGYIGGSHIDAVRRIPECELWAVADANEALAREKAEHYQVPKCYASIDALLADPEIEVIHNCTPNNLHTEINKKVLAAGKHLLSEKPLALNSQEAESLLEVHRAHPESVAAVNFNYRMNPMVQEMRARVASGEVGKINGVHGCYLQDWLLYDLDYSWRLEPEIAGPSCCVADIGSHWMDLVEHVLGERIVELVADLRTTFPVRKKPLKQVETFSTGKETPYEEVPVKNEDYASVIFRLSGGATGSFTVSEVSAGHGCYFQVEISGSKESLMWNQEQNDRMWVGRRNGENSVVLRDPAILSPEARAYTGLSKGHPEGWNDAFLNNIRGFYRHILLGEAPRFATLEDAAHIVKLTECCVESSRSRAWVRVEE